MADKETWYHGSPKRLSRLRIGSTITRNRELAEIFSHKPTLVSVEEDGRIRHNGVMRGYLYVIDEVICSDDVEPHPRTTMAPGEEWLTRRSLRLRLVGETELSEEDRLSDDEVAGFLQQLNAMTSNEEAQDGA
jgi:hypothetical protein